MNVYEEYQKKLTTPQQAVQCIQSGDWVDYGVCALVLFPSPLKFTADKIV